MNLGRMSQILQAKSKHTFTPIFTGFLQRVLTDSSPTHEVPPFVHEVLQLSGQPLDKESRSFFEPRFGHDFGNVRVYADAKAAQSAQALNALAYTVGNAVVFGPGQYAPQTNTGRRLMAHELTHVIQQEGYGKTGLTIENENKSLEREALSVANQVMNANTETAGMQKSEANFCFPEKITGQLTSSLPIIHRQNKPVIQGQVNLNVLSWDANKLGPPVPQNGTDPRFIDIPPSGQILVSALVEVNGGVTDPCVNYEIGTTQTAWTAWTIAHYQGQNVGDGRITVRHRASMPMRDPSPTGSIWFDQGNVRSPAFCGDSVGIFHLDSPWHSIPKMRNNNAVARSPLNYLRSYTRGMHAVTYLAARNPTGAFLVIPLRYLYWNSLQDFSFTPNFASPLSMWAHTGQVRINIGAEGHGETTDAPYFTTAGPNFNDHFSNTSYWDIDEQT